MTNPVIEERIKSLSGELDAAIKSADWWVKVCGRLSRSILIVSVCAPLVAAIVGWSGFDPRLTGTIALIPAVAISLGAIYRLSEHHDSQYQKRSYMAELKNRLLGIELPTWQDVARIAAERDEYMLSGPRVSLAHRNRAG